MYTSTRKLDRLRACSGSNFGWFTDSLVTGPDKHNSQHRFKSKACSGSNCGWSAASLTYSSRHGCMACSRHNYGWFIRANTHVGKQNRFYALRTARTREQRRPCNKPFTVNIPRTNILVCTYVQESNDGLVISHSQLTFHGRIYLFVRITPTQSS